MKHFTEEQITDYVYNEMTNEESLKVLNHIEQCHDCNEVYQNILSVNQLLSTNKNAQPENNTFDLIIEKIETEKKYSWSYVFIIFFVLSTFTLLYFFHSTILSLPLLNEFMQIELLKPLSGLTKSILLFFGFGTLLTFAITPVLVKESQLQELRSV